MTGRLRELFVMQVYGNRKWSATRIWRTGELMGLSSSRAVEIEADLDYRKKITKRREGGENKTKSYNAEFREVMDTKCIQMTRLEWQSTEGFVEN
jgi:predicted transcriptional regulator